MNAVPRPRLFALLWLVAGLCVVPLCFTLLFAAVAGMRWVAEQIAGVPMYDFWNDNFVLLVSLFGVISGCCVGILQQFIVNRTWRLKLSGWWRASTLGGLLGGMICWLLIEPIGYFDWLWSLKLTPPQYSILHFALPMLVFIFSLASLQTWMLRSACGAGTWLAAHVMGILLPTAFALLLFDPLEMQSSITGTIWFLSHFCLLTAFTGLAMHRIASRVSRQEKSKRKAPAPDMA